MIKASQKWFAAVPLIGMFFMGVCVVPFVHQAEYGFHPPCAADNQACHDYDFHCEEQAEEHEHDHPNCLVCLVKNLDFASSGSPVLIENPSEVPTQPFAPRKRVFSRNIISFLARAPPAEPDSITV